MPYDKGDFTQQGINGDVSALVRLNEKRVMKVVLSSDDESDNCDISGKVYDLLNGTSYDIGSGGGGGGDFTTATLTYTGTPNGDYVPLAIDVPDYNLLGSYGKLFSMLESPVTVILYKGKAYAELSSVQSISGDITYDSDMNMYIITGDCTVNFNGMG